jgi:hypothetical protein
MATVTVHDGISRGNVIHEQTFTLLKGLHPTNSGNTVITVEGFTLYGRPKANIEVESSADFTVYGELPLVTKTPKSSVERTAKRTARAEAKELAKIKKMARKGEQSESNGTDFELEVAKRLEEITKLLNFKLQV